MCNPCFLVRKTLRSISKPFFQPASELHACISASIQASKYVSKHAWQQETTYKGAEGPKAKTPPIPPPLARSRPSPPIAPGHEAACI